MAGYDLSAEHSGKGSDKAVPVISKKGNAQLRHAVYQAAHIPLWQSDVMHGPRVDINGKMRKSYLIAILDDHSRLIAGPPGVGPRAAWGRTTVTH